MVAFVKYEKFTEDLAKGVHNFDAAADTLKIALTNTAPNVATHTVRGDITEISAGNGYVAGGNDAQNSVSRSGGVTSVVGVDVVFTASGGTMATFQYAVLYNDTPASPLDPLIGYWNHGSAVSLANGESFTVDFGTEMFTIT